LTCDDAFDVEAVLASGRRAVAPSTLAERALAHSVRRGFSSVALRWVAEILGPASEQQARLTALLGRAPAA